MNTESIIKLFILFGTLYLFMKCLNNQENFDVKKFNLKKPGQLTFLNTEGVGYYIVSLEQFKPKHQTKIIAHMTKNMPELVNPKFNVNSFNPMPMFLVRSIDLEEYASSDVSNFYIINFEDKFAFVPKISNKPTPDEYVYIEKKHGMLCYSPTYIKDRMLIINKNDDIQPNSIKPIKIDDLTLYVFDMTGSKNIKHFIKQ